jgi:hypothetical protein
MIDPSLLLLLLLLCGGAMQTRGALAGYGAV